MRKRIKSVCAILLIGICLVGITMKANGDDQISHGTLISSPTFQHMEWVLEKEGLVFDSIEVSGTVKVLYLPVEGTFATAKLGGKGKEYLNTIQMEVEEKTLKIWSETQQLTILKEEEVPLILTVQRTSE